MRHHWYGTALGCALVGLGSVGSASAAWLGDVPGALYALVVLLGVALCYRAAEVAYERGREQELASLLETMRHARERERDREPADAAAHKTVVVSAREDATPQAADLR